MKDLFAINRSAGTRTTPYPTTPAVGGCVVCGAPTPPARITCSARCKHEYGARQNQAVLAESRARKRGDYYEGVCSFDPDGRTTTSEVRE